jgi:hypothetical protein
MNPDDSNFEEARALVYEDRRRMRELRAMGGFKTIANAALLTAIELPVIAFWLFLAIAPDIGSAAFAQMLAAGETRSILLVGLLPLGTMNALLVPRWSKPVDDEVSRVADLLLVRDLAVATSGDTDRRATRAAM